MGRVVGRQRVFQVEKEVYKDTELLNLQMCSEHTGQLGFARGARGIGKR